MEFEQILELINAVSETQITTVKYEEGNQKIMISKNELREIEDKIEAKVETKIEDKINAQTERKTQVKTEVREVDVQEMNIEKTEVQEGNIVTCPLVGMFYSAPSEDAESFVKIGDRVKKGQTLAIVEAMKLMNEIESDFEGEVVEILAENAQGVVYGQALFVIR